MITIPVRVCGDHWVNPEEVSSLLAQIAGKDHVVLDLHSEAPSLASLGITDVIDSYCREYCVSPADIHVNHWSNPAEPVPYTRMNLHLKSHLFERSRTYWSNTVEISSHDYVFGFFIGRRTVPRLVAMHYLYHKYRNSALLSCLSTVNSLPWGHPSYGINLDLIHDWIEPDSIKSFRKWWESNPISSLDGHAMSDCYHPEMNTNSDILQFYSKFDIELVSESYTRGNTFFPTEKTVRPIMASKPMVVYGPKKFLTRLRDLGFETYHSVWDESYDHAEGIDRWNAIKHLIDFIMAMSDSDRLAILQQANQIAIRNRLHLAKMINI